MLEEGDGAALGDDDGAADGAALERRTAPRWASTARRAEPRAHELSVSLEIKVP